MSQNRAHPRQQEFLQLTCEEALYGGAAGGGKTEALLMWLAEGISIKAYSGLFLRRTFAQLSKSNDSPIIRSIDLYKPLGGTYNSTDHRWTFPSGAMIEFGHMQHETSIQDYQGPSFHRIAFDELTQFTETQYLYMFSRMRKAAGFPIYLGVRASSNPGGVGHEWVARRFVTRDARNLLKKLSYLTPSPPGAVFWPTTSRAFVPARVADNPTLDVKDYLDRMLGHLPKRLREQMAAGDWDVVEGSLIQPQWFQRYGYEGHTIWKLQGKNRLWVRDDREMWRFATIDTAGTSRDVAEKKKGKTPSQSVVLIWDYDRTTRDLFLRYVWCDRVTWLELKRSVFDVLRWWKPKRVAIENAHFGPSLREEIGTEFSCVMLPTVVPEMTDSGRGAKLERAIAVKLFERLEKGQVWLPDPTECKNTIGWCEPYEAELTSWTGDPEDLADRVDGTSYAVFESDRYGSSWGGVVNGKSQK